MLLADLVATSQAVAATRSRTAKVAALADCLRRLRGRDIGIGISFLTGEPLQGRTGIGHALLAERDTAAAATATLTLREVDDTLRELVAATGPGSRARRAALLDRLWARSTTSSRRILLF